MTFAPSDSSKKAAFVRYHASPKYLSLENVFWATLGMERFKPISKILSCFQFYHSRRSKNPRLNSRNFFLKVKLGPLFCFFRWGGFRSESNAVILVDREPVGCQLVGIH